MTPDLDMVVVHRGEPPRIDPDPWAGPPGQRVVQLAHAIAASRAWSGRDDATLVARGGAAPAIAAIGRFDDATRRWLERCAAQLAQHLPNVVWLDHAAVESGCEALAAALQRRFDAHTLRSAEYRAVPRGGLCVLGPLAYLLDLPARCLAHDPSDPSRPLVLVDDVAVTGLRLTRTLAALRDDRDVIVATLHSHPSVRDALLQRHERLVAMLSAVDLHDRAPLDRGDGYAAWRDRWRDRVGSETPWIGEPERVAYPWNDPDVGVWNDLLEREEPGWDVIPPARCLKSRARASLRVARMPTPPGPLAPNDDVLFARHGPDLVLGDTGVSATYRLDGFTATAWEALVAHGDVAIAAAHLTRDGAEGDDELRSALHSVAVELLAAGVLVDRERHA